MPPVRASEHFSWSEFACHDRLHTPYPLDWRADRGVELARELERIRLRIGPFTPNSVFRTWAYHEGLYRRLGQPVVRNSQHLQGRAADVPLPRRLPWEQARAAILEAAHEDGSRIRYIKFYPAEWFAHVDNRPTRALIVEG